MAIQSILKRLLLSLVFLAGLTGAASGQDTTTVIRISKGIPAGLRKIDAAQMETTLQQKAMKLAVRHGYKINKDWNDTIKYWSNEGNILAVSFINSHYEYAVIVFNRRGKWLQTTNYPNPEFNETSGVMAALEEKGYNVNDLNSPVGSIIKYETRYDTWYEAEAYENSSPHTIVKIVLDKHFRFLARH